MKPITWLSPQDAPDCFPPADQALEEPPGLLAAGGDLSPARLLAAYRRGIFPWYSPGQPVLWWSPDPRAVLFPEEFRCTRSLGKTIRNGGFTVELDRDFPAVIDACAAPRAHSLGTWITTTTRTASRRIAMACWLAACMECGSAASFSANPCSARSGMRPKWRWLTSLT